MKKFVILIVILAVLLGVAIFLGGNSSAGLIWSLSNQGQWLFPLISIASLVDSVNPCSFSVLILTIAFLFSIGKLRNKILKIGGVYILGIFVAYFLIGLGILGALHIFDTPHFMGKLGASLLIALGAISLINEFVPQFPIKLKIPKIAHHKIAQLMERASIPTAFVLGGLVGLCEFPCTGGPYLSVLGLLHDKVTYFKGFTYLAWYNVIFVLPLIILLLIAANKASVEKIQYWQASNKRSFHFFGGIAAIVLGVVILLA